MDFPHSNQRGPALCALFALIICGYAAFTKPATHHRRVDRHEAHLHVDLAHSHPVSPHLFGAFFEEVRHLQTSAMMQCAVKLHLNGIQGVWFDHASLDSCCTCLQSLHQRAPLLHGQRWHMGVGMFERSCKCERLTTYFH